MSERFLEIWLRTVGLGFAVFGVFMAVAYETWLFREVFGPLIESSFWSGRIPLEAQDFRAWAYGAWGGTISGFGLLLAVVARPAISGRNIRLRKGTLAALSLWFAIDSAASLVHGVWANALVINLPAYLALSLPLILARAR